MLNEVSFKKFAIISLSLFLAFNGSISLNHFGIDIPLVRQIFGFLFLTFIPGYTILRILQIYKADKVEALLYAVGLSLLYIMSVDILINFILPLLGIKKPISLKPLLPLFDTTYLLLFIWSYFKDENYREKNDTIGIGLKDVLDPQVLALVPLPILAMWGAYSMNEYINSVVILLIGCLFITLPLQKGSKRIFTLWIMSLALLYVYWMFSPHIWGADIYGEAYFSKLTLDNGYWNATIQRNLNSIPLVTLAIPTFSELFDISITYVFKVLMPFYISLLPISLYLLYYYYFTDNKVPILASILFFISDLYYKVDITAVRQVIAELYIVLLLIVITHRRNKRVLMLFFIWAIIFSHYGSASIFFLMTIGVFVMSRIIKPKDNINDNVIKKVMFLYTAAMISWYLYVSNSSLLYTYGSLANVIIKAFSGILLPKTALNIVLIKTGLIGRLYKVMYLITQILIVVGFLYYFHTKKRGLGIFDYFSIMGMGIWGLMITVPFFAMFMDVWRTYHFSLLFTSCYFSIGVLVAQRVITKIIRTNISKKNVYLITTIFLAIFLLFNTGIIYNTFSYKPKEIPTSWTWMKESQNRWVFYMRVRLFEESVTAGKWISEYVDIHVPIITDMPSSSPLQLSAGVDNPIILKTPYDAQSGEIIFLGNSVIFSRLYILKGIGVPGPVPYSKYCVLINHMIYTNDGSIILKVRY